MGRSVSGNSVSSVPSAGTTFQGMPFIQAANGSSVSYNSIHFKTGLTTSHTRGSLTPLTIFGSGVYGNGANIVGSSINTWATVVSTTGTKGKLFNVIPNVPFDAASETHIEVTIDGVVYTYVSLISGTGATCILGAVVISGATPSVTNGFSVADFHHPSSYNDPGFQGGIQYHLINPHKAFEVGFPYLQWNNDMQVRVKVVGTTIDKQDAAASFIYD